MSRFDEQLPQRLYFGLLKFGEYGLWVVLLKWCWLRPITWRSTGRNPLFRILSAVQYSSIVQRGQGGERQSNSIWWSCWGRRQWGTASPRWKFDYHSRISVKGNKRTDHQQIIYIKEVLPLSGFLRTYSARIYFIGANSSLACLHMPHPSNPVDDIRTASSYWEHCSSALLDSELEDVWLVSSASFLRVCVGDLPARSVSVWWISFILCFLM